MPPKHTVLRASFPYTCCASNILASSSKGRQDERRQGDRRQVVELLQHLARRRVVVRRLPGAAHLLAVPQDGRGAARARLRSHRARRARLAVVANAEGRSTRSALHRNPQRTRSQRQPARRRVPQGAEPHPGPGEVAAPHQGPHRRRAVDGTRSRREGRRVRRAPGEERRRHEVGRGAVLHAACADLGNRST